MLYRSMAAALTIALCIGAGPGRGQQSGTDAAAIELAFRAWQTALVSRDAATLDRIAAPEFVQVEGDGPIDRRMAIGMPTHSPDYRIEDVKIESVRVTVSGDDGQLAGVTVVRENFNGRIYTTRKSVAETWTRRGGTWVLKHETLQELK